jgi:hypothetical protein
MRWSFKHGPTASLRREELPWLYLGQTDQALENDEFFKMLRSIENNPEAQREFMRSANALRYDFTQHYKTSNRDHVKENGGSHNNGPVVAIGAD